jgi:hypothetical protein
MDITKLFRARVDARRQQGMAAYRAALGQVPAADNGANAESAADRVLSAAAAAGVAAEQAERDYLAAAAAAVEASRSAAKVRTVYLAPSATLARPIPLGFEKFVSYVRGPLAAPTGAVVLTPGPWNAVPYDGQPNAEVEMLTKVVRWAATRVRGTDPFAQDVLRREGVPAGVGQGSATEVGRSRPGWRILLAKVETDILMARPGAENCERKRVFCGRLGRGDLCPVICVDA